MRTITKNKIFLGDTSKINLDTLEETLNLITPEFPYMANICDLHTCPDNTFPWHWHNEVEFFYMKDGELTYQVPSGKFHFKKGEGGFINANILHMTYCKDEDICKQEEHIFLPSFVGGAENSIIMHKYILPIILNSDFEIFRLEPDCKEHAEIISLLAKNYDIYVQKEDGYEFDIRENISKVWKLFYQLTKEQQIQKSSHISSQRIKAMLAFIAEHYGEKLTLQQIADSGFISVRECCRCFKENLGTTPFGYLTDYRLYKACEFLKSKSPELSITDIAIACGFGSSSYFTKLFREKFGCTPKEYSRQNL